MAYLFHPESLNEIARKYVGVPHEQMVQGGTDDLARAYPGHIETRRRWVFNLAGGWVGVMPGLHPSLSEHVLLFGTPIGARDFSRRYRLHAYDPQVARQRAAVTRAQPVQ